MILETVYRAVGCDDCTAKTDTYCSFDCNGKLPSCKEIRESEGFHRVKRNGKMVDLCPACYAVYIETLGGAK